MQYDVIRMDGSCKDNSIVRGYQFLSTLGEGSFGKVKLALNTKTGDQVTIHQHHHALI